MTSFDGSCRACERLAGFLDQVRCAHPGYHSAPVAPFGDANARLIIVGLAPGLHGANRTGRPFTGDYAGILLYETLHKFGFASAPVSTSCDDRLRLIDCRITNSVKCLPPANKPLPLEIQACNKYLAHELNAISYPHALLALGTIAHDAVLRARGHKRKAFAFSHGAEHPLADNVTLFDSYHCSRYNTQTRRLTPAMFEAVVARARAHLATLNQGPHVCFTAREKGGT